MNLQKAVSNNALKEGAFQLILHLVVFYFYAIDRRNPQIEEFEIIFFLDLAFFAFLINYLFLPSLFYRKKYFQFSLMVVAILAGAIVMEETVLEKIYFPLTRGSRFPGIFYTLVGILPVITVLVGFKFAWDAYSKQREVERLKEVVKESELQFLKSQINPHFLFNNLNNLYAHAIENSSRTPEIILELSAVLRYMLYDCKAAYVPLYKEIEQLKNFIKISELQVEERGNVRFHVNKEDSRFQIAPLLLVVFVENAFKHSTASQSENIDIDVSLNVSDTGKMEFVCMNSFEEQSNVDQLSSGIGLENVKKRLELLYPNAYELTINSSDGKYKVRLQLQLKPIDE